ncbi:phage holin family protein [Roseisolibacter agri]|uniref:Phage holin family protein n=1 Tax=Roseisolibacter agri TaxID=2014610 RepID=A0AA37QH20_9BACT|nr:phage holin family protein [Roseisolibacter agri]GLC26673.1 hypothetical protein rosag_31860 [Roseisolibacter agri]
MSADGRSSTGSEGRGLSSLLRDLAEGSGELMRQELRLARVEARDLARGLGVGTVEVAVGAVLALLGGLALLSGLILLAGDQWLRDRYWLAALLVTAVAGVVGAVFARRGLALLSPHALAPDQTVATLKEDKEWLRQLRT